MFDWEADRISSMLLTVKAALLSQLGHVARAAELAQRVLELVADESPCRRAEALNVLGWYLHRLELADPDRDETARERWAEAAKLYETGCDRPGEHANC